MAKDGVDTFQKKFDLINQIQQKEKESVTLRAKTQAQERYLNKLVDDRQKSLDAIAKSKNNINALGKIEQDISKSIKGVSHWTNKNEMKKYKIQQTLVKARIKELKIQENIKKETEEMRGFMPDLVQAAEDFTEVLKSPIGIFTAIISLIGVMFSSFSSAIDDIGKRFGAIGVKEFADDLMSADAELVALGYDAGTAADIATTLSNEFGTTFQEAADAAAAVGELAKATGASVQSASKVFGLFTKIGGLTSQQAIDLAKQAESLAIMEGVAPGAVMEEIAKSTNMFAKYGKQGGKNIVKAAIQAKKLGVEMSTVEKVMDGLLDFENSLNKEMEASIMLGKQLNFQKARELALSGDIDGAMKNVLQQVGGQAEFDKMNVLQKQALADSIGVGVDELANFTANQKKAAKEGGKLEDQDFSEMVGKDAMSAMTEMKNELKSMAAILTKTLMPPLNNLLKLFNTFLKPIKSIVNFFGEWGAGAKTVAFTIGALLVPSMYRGIVAMKASTMETIKNTTAQAANIVKKNAMVYWTGLITAKQYLASAATAAYNLVLNQQTMAETMLAARKTVLNTLMTIGNALKVKEIALSAKAAARSTKEAIKAGVLALANFGKAVSGFFAGAAAGSGATLGFGTAALVAIAVAAVAAMVGAFAMKPKLETGTELGGVKSAGVAELHPGETVLNKEDTETAKSMNGKGGGGSGAVVAAIQALQADLQGLKASMDALPAGVGSEVVASIDSANRVKA